MKDIEIPKTQWSHFCDSFCRQHHGWLVSIRQFDTNSLELAQTSQTTSARLFTGDLPLQEVRERANDDHMEIMVTVGTGKDERSVLVEDVLTLYSRRVGAADQGLRMDCGNGTTTLVEFRAAMPPEALDGLAESER